MVGSYLYFCLLLACISFSKYNTTFGFFSSKDIYHCNKNTRKLFIARFELSYLRLLSILVPSICTHYSSYIRTSTSKLITGIYLIKFTSVLRNNPCLIILYKSFISGQANVIENFFFFFNMSSKCLACFRIIILSHFFHTHIFIPIFSPFTHISRKKNTKIIIILNRFTIVLKPSGIRMQLLGLPL